MNITIKENHEPLVDIKKYCPGVVVRIGKERMKVEKTAYLRKKVAEMLQNAQKSLPRGMNFIINDAWRPAYVQAKIYFGFIERFKKMHPKWPEKKIIKEVEKYVANWKGVASSGHMSGGAVDIRLVDKHKHKIPMKKRGLTYQQNALSDQKLLPAYIRKNREIMFSALRGAGLSNYPKEYWHWSYGDYQWARRNGKRTALYGTILDVNPVRSSRGTLSHVFTKTKPHSFSQQVVGRFASNGVKGLYSKKMCPCGQNKKFIVCHGK